MPESKKHTQGPVFTFKYLRVLFLLTIFVLVAAMSYQQSRGVRDWSKTLYVTLYPIAGDDSPGVRRYLRRLEEADFLPISRFLEQEARAYGLESGSPVLIRLGRQLPAPPPDPPPARDRLGIIWWSLKLRYWLYQQVSSFGLDTRHIRLFVVYHRGEPGRALRHSFALTKGLIGVVHAFGDRSQRQQNLVIITHELLHTLGASDKYDADGLPAFPDGFAEPDRIPRYPQELAEIMGGRIPIRPGEAVIPADLSQCLIGPRTAQEIHWDVSGGGGQPEDT